MNSLLTMHSPEQLLESFARCTKNGYVAINNKSEITYFNQTMTELTGWHEAEMLGKSATSLYALESGGTFTNNHEILIQGAILFSRDGKKTSYTVRRAKILDNEGKPDGELIVFVTEQYSKDGTKAQADFVSTVSHELRTPITSIKGFAATLLHHKSNLDPEKRDRYVKVIKEQAERLQRLIEDLLAVSRLENRKLQIVVQPLDIKRIVDNVAIVVESKHSNSNHVTASGAKQSHTITVIAPNKLPEVWADPDRVEQILTNLIDNAIKYSPGAGKVEVKISETTVDLCKLAEAAGNKDFGGAPSPVKCQEHKMILVEVTDFGEGIDTKDLTKIFNKFSRLDNVMTRKTEGTGLGLFISKSLARLLGGDIQLRSKKGETTFSLYLPTEELNAKPWWA